MHREASEPRASSGPRLERAVILELLSDAAERRSLAELSIELDADADDLQAAVSSLDAAGVVCVEAELAWASPAARRLDALELIGI